MIVPEFGKRASFLLEVNTVPGGARVSLCPVRSAATATLRGYTSVAIDHRELQRLTYELKVLLGRVNMRGQLDPAASAEVCKLGHLLFDELLPPAVKTLLREHEGHDLLIRTDETLVDVPWELLHTGTQFLALRWNIGRLLSASTADTMLMPRPRPLRAPYRALLLADPCGDLDAAYEEGMQLHGLLDGQLYLDVTLKSSEIARAYLRENIREFDILHFAGHAELGGQGEGWLLSDGRFTTEDIARMAGGKPFPSLIFANACGSGRGGRSRLDGANAAMTLARTFISAGTRHFIGAHW
ncbi:MAG: CHAT domain-containing protein, partial [Myxococcota bacterium]